MVSRERRTVTRIDPKVRQGGKGLTLAEHGSEFVQPIDHWSGVGRLAERGSYGVLPCSVHRFWLFCGLEWTHPAASINDASRCCCVSTDRKLPI